MKQLCVISAPPDTYSGYGARARDFIKAIYELKKDEWDIKILSQRWGVTPWGFIESNKEEWGWMGDLILQDNRLHAQPDVWFQLTVPNEFQPVGKVNIGVTAGIETTVCDHTWLEGCNKMDVTLVSSFHAKRVFEASNFEQKDSNSGATIKLRLTKPVEVLFEGVDLNKYFYIPEKEIPSIPLVADLESIKESFCFLHVGHWLQGEFGEDRKNTGVMIKLFLETFKGKKNKPALVLKTSHAGANIIDREEVLKKIEAIRNSLGGGNDLPNIYLIHGDMEDSDINVLYNHPKVKAFISFTKGEGYGRPLAEFCLSKKPVLASGWSGHIDFLNSEYSVLLPGTLTPVHPSVVVPNIIIKEASWFSIDPTAASRAMLEVYENYDKFEVGGKRQGHKIKTEFSYDNMVLLLGTYLDKYTLKKVDIKLPQLKKIELPKLQKVNP
jgi:hypothetical protein